MKKLLKEYVRELLMEEIVTVTRGNEQFTYEMEFDDKGGILSSSKVALNPDEIDVINKVKKYSVVPQGVLLKKIRQLKEKNVQLQADAISPKNVAEVMNRHWLDTLDWPSGNRLGRGELQLRLAFDVDQTASEPDFVSKDGISLSVKYAGANGSQPVKTGEANRDITTLTSKFARALALPNYPQGRFSGNTLLHLMDIEGPLIDLKTAREILTMMKEIIIREHKADGILMFDDKNGFYLIDNPNEIHVIGIKNSGTRIEFVGPHLSQGLMTLDRALDSLERKIVKS